MQSSCCSYASNIYRCHTACTRTRKFGKVKMNILECELCTSKYKNKFKIPIQSIPCSYYLGNYSLIPGSHLSVLSHMVQKQQWSRWKPETLEIIELINMHTVTVVGKMLFYLIPSAPLPGRNLPLTIVGAIFLFSAISLIVVVSMVFLIITEIVSRCKKPGKFNTWAVHNTNQTALCPDMYNLENHLQLWNFGWKVYDGFAK